MLLYFLVINTAFWAGAMMLELLSSTQTWPKSRINNTLAQQVNENIRTDQILNEAREFVASPPPAPLSNNNTTASITDSETIHQGQARALIERLIGELEKATEKKREQDYGGSRPLNVIKEENTKNMAKELQKRNLQLSKEPDFSSMILCDTKSRMSRQSIVEHPYGNYRINTYQDGCQDVDLASLYEEQDPVGGFTLA